jgi:hypothetical protein
MSYTFLAMHVASEMRRPDVDMTDAVCLEDRNQKRNHPSLCLTTAFQSNVNHLKSSAQIQNSCK